MSAVLIEEALGNRALLPRIVLIACGSFSPPTPMHLRMFEIARDHFEVHGTHQLIGGIVSPTHDAYGKKGLAPEKHRCAMVKLALQTSNWIRVSDWETTQPQWSRTHSVLQYHQNFMNNHINSGGMDDNAGLLPGWLPSGLRERRDPVQLKLLCGADLLESFAVPGLWADEDIEAIIANHGLVVISRSGANPEKFIFDSDILTKYQSNITLVTNWVPNEVSSTMIRRLVGRGQSVKYLIDDLVLEYIKSNGLFNYNSKYIKDARICNLIFVKGNKSNHLMSQAASSNDNTPSSDDDDEDDEAHRVPEEADVLNDDDAVEHMDETDYSMKNILNSINLDNRKATVKAFCCRDSNAVAAKLMPQQRSNAMGRPGQAVQVITSESVGARAAVAVQRPEGQHRQAKKMKITAAQQV